MWHLQKNKLLNGDLQSFIMQDVKNLLPSYAHKISRGITDVAGLVSNLFGGKKRKKIVHTSKPPIEVQSGGAVFTTMPVVRPMIGHGVIRF